jgi:hypothetical protein
VPKTIHFVENILSVNLLWKMKLAEQSQVMKFMSVISDPTTVVISLRSSGRSGRSDWSLKVLDSFFQANELGSQYVREKIGIKTIHLSFSLRDK